MNKLLIAALAAASFGAANAQSSIVMLNQQTNPVSDIQYGDYEFAFLMSNGSYIGLRRSNGQLEVIPSPSNYSFRSRYAMRSLTDTGPQEDVITLPGFSVVGASGVGFAGLIDTGILEDFTADGYTKGKFSPNDYEGRTYLTDEVWFKTIPLPNIASSIRVGLAGFFSTSLTRIGNATANAGAFHAVSADLAGTCQTNAVCFNTHNESHFDQVRDGAKYFWPSYSAATAYTTSTTVPALDLLKPLTYGTKKIRLTMPATTIKFRRRTVKHPTKPSVFFRSCLGVSEVRRTATTVSDTAVERLLNYVDTVDNVYGSQGIYTRCEVTSPTIANSISTPSRGGTFATTRRQTKTATGDNLFFCSADIDALECSVLYGAPFYQASTDLRSLSYVWQSKFYLVDTLSSKPRSLIAVPAGVTPTKFFGYVGNL